MTFSPEQAPHMEGSVYERMNAIREHLGWVALTGRADLERTMEAIQLANDGSFSLDQATKHDLPPVDSSHQPAAA